MLDIVGGATPVSSAYSGISAVVCFEGATALALRNLIAPPDATDHRLSTEYWCDKAGRANVEFPNIAGPRNLLEADSAGHGRLKDVGSCKKGEVKGCLLSDLDNSRIITRQGVVPLRVDRIAPG
ncbi:hypothetical protein [Mesorhizobium hawassense]|uniref:hypothetical protein n=1 Tax=Mesorhizobium hawassense TaxID=1209954 RepID=UPI0011BE3C77|nr:hypothetical protein [Mesorhizobium hawassense]